MTPAIDDYLKLVSPPESQWDLFKISLETCRIISPEIDFGWHYEYLERLTAAARDVCSPDGDLYSTINGINEVLFESARFSANDVDYFAPENSYMNLVLETGKGIPITLSLLYREVASRIGLRLECVAMPGHFLLKTRTPSRELFIDSFHRGQICLADECLELMQRITQTESDAASPEFLKAASNRAVILRLLMNLKAIYRRNSANRLLLEVIERRIPILDDPLPEILERGLLKISLEDYPGALADLESFLDSTQNAEMQEVVEKQIDRIRKLASSKG